MAKRYTIIRHHEGYGLLCLWDAREGIAVTIHQALWMALQYEEL